MSKKSNAQKSEVVEVVEQVEVEQPVVERVRPETDDKGRYKTVDVSMEEVQAMNFKTKSAQIRWLASLNFSPMAISKFMGIIYQHVRNELNRELKKPVVVAPAPAAEVKVETTTD